MVKITIKELSEPILAKLKAKFFSDDVFDKKTGYRELVVSETVCGEEYIYGIRYISELSAAMTFEIIFETSSFDDYIECCPVISKAHTADEAWNVFEKLLKSKLGF